MIWLKKLISVFIGLIIAFALCEIILRIYNPFQSRVRGNEIILKSNYKKKVMIDPAIPGLDQQVLYSTNSLGFRGPELPAGENNLIRILTVGGSTTECSLLSDDSTWPSRLYRKLNSANKAIWLNNAGIDGCSSYGHIILMRDYVVKLKPDFVLFLIGINDLVKSNFSHEDGFLINRKEDWWRSLLKKSELITTLSNVMEAFRASKANVAHGNNPMDYKNNDLNQLDSTGRMKTEEKLPLLLDEYRKRIERLHGLSDSAGIQAVFITQPKFDDTLSYSSVVMEKYNDVVRRYCREKRLTCIDLAGKLPKVLANYYDQIHFTNRGAETISSILAPEILKIIQTKQ